ncbi:hypothetical protein [Pseudomonas sp. LP_7_YM]|uniref:hypothetical protein n=1 Tax=Pseudomonas sp. LP_7_YM TaxID=2485137 RepID=UPI00105B550D|nr:hypothetical protein [Pseudomonas sp. LP_7_YM]TDV62587.1 hypothetical protein EC915_107173 [Pseudomonas sp. LP_7_YM]
MAPGIRAESYGEYMLFNSNVDIDMLRLAVIPRQDLNFGVMGSRFQFDKSLTMRPAVISPRNWICMPTGP